MYKVILIIFSLLLVSCHESKPDVNNTAHPVLAKKNSSHLLAKKHHRIDVESVVYAPDILQIFNENYTNVKVTRDSGGYVYLQLPKNQQTYQKLKDLTYKYALASHKKCFVFNPNRNGLHITLLEYENIKYASDYDTLIGKTITVKYKKFYIISRKLSHTHTKEIIYAVDVELRPEDYNLVTDSTRAIERVPLHVTLALFKKDNNNQCVISKQHALAN